MKQLVFNLWGRIVPLVVIVGLTLVVGCSSSTDPDPEPEPREPEPVEREGARELTVTVIDRDDESELTGYNIDISGPVTASEENVSESEYVLEGLESGEYTIEVTLDGYVDASITEEYEVPEDESEDYLAGVTVSLRPYTPPVKVDNSQPTTVQTGKPDSEDATEEEAVTLEIPANTFPAEVVNEDGSVDVSVTRARPTQATAGESGGQVSESLILSPAAQLNDTVTITVPIREIEGLEGVEYVLQPGDIPLTPDNSGNLVAKISPSSSMLLADQNAEVDEFRSYTIVADNAEVEVEFGFTDYVGGLGNGECGVAVDADYSKEAVSIPANISTYADDVNQYSKSFTTTVEVDAVEDRILRVSARNRTKTYTLLIGGEERSSVTVNMPIVQTQVEQIVCHDSGNN